MFGRMSKLLMNGDWICQDPKIIKSTIKVICTTIATLQVFWIDTMLHTMQ